MNEKIEILESVMIKTKDNNNENGESIILEPGDIVEVLPPDDLELDEFPYSDSERILREKAKRMIHQKIESKQKEEEKKQYAQRVQRVQKRIKVNEEKEENNKPYELKRKVDPNSFIETRDKKYNSFHKGDSELMNNKTKKEK